MGAVHCYGNTASRITKREVSRAVRDGVERDAHSRRALVEVENGICTHQQHPTWWSRGEEGSREEREGGRGGSEEEKNHE